MSIDSAISSSTTIPELLQQVEDLLHHDDQSTEMDNLDLEEALFNTKFQVEVENTHDLPRINQYFNAKEFQAPKDTLTKNNVIPIQVINNDIVIIYHDEINSLPLPSLITQRRKKWLIVPVVKKIMNCLPYWSSYQNARQLYNKMIEHI